MKLLSINLQIISVKNCRWDGKSFLELGSWFLRDFPGLTMPFLITLWFDLISAYKISACCSIFLFASLQSLPAYTSPIFYSRSFVILVSMPSLFALIFNLISAYKMCFLIYFFFCLLSYNLCLYITTITFVSAHTF